MIINENNQIIKFDTIKIKADASCLIEIYSKFNDIYNPNTGEKTGIVYNSKDDYKSLFNLYIAVSYYKKTLTIEFSSKILFESYPSLISKHTIKECLNNINKKGICKIDVDLILETGCFTNLHVTKDVNFQLSGNVLNELNDKVKNYRRFKWDRYLNDGITFTSDVKSSNCKETITFYNKEKELEATVEKRNYINSLNNKKEIIESFKGKTRIEIRLSTQKKIKDYLNIADTKINTVLNSMSNPILKQLNKVFGEETTNEEPSNIDTNNWENFTMYTILKEYNFNLKLVEQKVRRLYPSNSGYYERIKKLEAIQNTIISNPNINYIAEIRNLLI